MRVLHLTTEFPPIVYGGLGTAVGGLAAASSRAGIEVAVLLVGAGGQCSYVHSAPVENRLAQAIVRPTAGIHLYSASHNDAERLGTQLIRDWQPDVLHLHVFWLSPLARA